MSDTPENTSNSPTNNQPEASVDFDDLRREYEEQGIYTPAQIDKFIETRRASLQIKAGEDPTIDNQTEAHQQSMSSIEEYLQKRREETDSSEPPTES